MSRRRSLMSQSRSATLGIPVLGLAAVLASACGGGDSSSTIGPNPGAGGSQDASSEVSAGGTAGTSGGGGTAGSSGKGGSAGTSGTGGQNEAGPPDASPDVSDDGPEDGAAGQDNDAADGADAFSCKSDTDCAGNPLGPICNVAAGQCVACSETDTTTCEQGKWCDPATFTCQPGCDDAQDCSGGTTCDPLSHACVGCLTDDECPVGQTCQSKVCAPGCTQVHGCQNGATCCTGQCVFTDVDPANCGLCGFACNLPNAKPMCIGGKCGLEECLPGWKNCDQKAANGCEAADCPCAPNAVESCYSGPAGTEDVGPCHGGTRTCNDSGSAWGPCEGEALPAQESCFTAIDDNCNGQVNESGPGCVCQPNATEPCYSGAAGTRGVGACKDGQHTCNASGTAWGPCDGEVLPAQETCATSLDDDCDGQVNEVGGTGCLCAAGSTVSCYGGPPGTAGVGACKSGTQTCNSMGTGWEACTGDVVPSPDVCTDNLDNDCNGVINDGFLGGAAGCACFPSSNVACYSGPQGTKGVGVCVGGVATCNVSGTGTGACNGEVTPSADSCNDSLDNDCNGIPNDGAGSGGAGCVCVPGAQVACYEGPAGTQGVGVCKAGARTCDADGKAWGACFGQVIPDFDRCDNTVDDDCNGTINDGFSSGAQGCLCAPGTTGSCYTGPSGSQGVGTCHAGSHTCNTLGTAWSVCTGEVTPVTEVCSNNLDDDCNGVKDDVADTDGDGWTRCNGDCCETTSQCGSPKQVNPGAIEVQGDNVDNNCNNSTDENPYTTCSTGTSFTTDVSAAKALSMLNAMEICQVSQNGSWGIVSGTPALTRASGSSSPDYRQVGIIQQLGTASSNVPQAGNNMAMLSSGRARDANDPDPNNTHSFTYYGDGAPSDFIAAHANALPSTRPGCPNGSSVNDGTALRVQLKVPTNANSFSFKFRFFSQEYWYYTCTEYNDFFVALLNSQWTPGAGQTAIPADKNISFDSNGSYISVNSVSFFTTCCQAKSGYACPDGNAALAGTGFYESPWNDVGGGATRWLTTTSPVKPGETITLRFVIWDTSDQLLDSSVLLDNFRWSATPSNGPITQ